MTRRPNAAGSVATAPYAATAPQSWPMRTRGRRRGIAPRTSRTERTYVPTLIGLSTARRIPVARRHHAVSVPGEIGSEMPPVCGVSGKPCTRTASGSDVSSMSPKVAVGLSSPERITLHDVK